MKRNWPHRFFDRYTALGALVGFAVVVLVFALLMLLVGCEPDTQGEVPVETINWAR